MNAFTVKTLLSSMLKTYPESVDLGIPFFSKFTSLEDSDRYLEHGDITTDDWQESGVATLDEYLKMVDNGCGPAVLLSILSIKDLGFSLIDIYQALEERGGFTEDIGLDYSIALDYLKTLGFLGYVLSYLDTRMIKYLVSQGKYVVISVSKEIGMSNLPTPKKKGGHLVLVTGYGKDYIRIHNSSGSYRSKMQEDYKVPTDQFARYFSGRGFVVYE